SGQAVHGAPRDCGGSVMQRPHSTRNASSRLAQIPFNHSRSLALSALRAFIFESKPSPPSNGYSNCIVIGPVKPDAFSILKNFGFTVPWPIGPQTVLPPSPGVCFQ